MTVPLYETREQWLNAFVDLARLHFAAADYAIPHALRVSIGFPSAGRRGKAIEECWSRMASADQHFEIFLRPSLDNDSRIADVLTHELIHAAIGLEHKHGAAFKRCMRAVGLEGKATATIAGKAWHKWADPILAQLGPMPHAALRDGGTSNAPPKQTTRLVKLECPDCGFICRTTAKHIDANPEGLRCPSVTCEGMLS